MPSTGLDGSETCATDAGRLSIRGHLVRIAGLLMLASGVLGWLAAHTDILFADGLRYLAQAQAISAGLDPADLRRAVDHPAYPALIAMTQALTGGESPQDWQWAAQLASMAAAVLLVVPLYLVARELFGDRAALPACVIVELLPVTGHVFADTLSESTFLLFWTWGLWGALRFFRSGSFRWAGLVAVMSALAYLSRPEGLLLPAAVATTLVLCHRWFLGGLGRRGAIALLTLVVGVSALVGPYVVLKGGLTSKPSIARLLGRAPKSPAHAVERARPLDPKQTTAQAYVAAAKAVWKAVTAALTPAVWPLAILGLVVASRRDAEAARQWRLLGVIGAASVLALMRLHATGGYCSPRHALILVLIAAPAAGYALGWLFQRVTTDERLRRLGWIAAVATLAAWNGRDLLAPVNEGLGGYRQAGEWLARNAGDAGPIVDVTGWSQFYGQTAPGYTFANLHAAASDPGARWVVAREAHMIGPWGYCQQMRALVDGLEPVQVFASSAGGRPTRVLLFDRQPLLARQSARADALRR